MLKYYEDNLSLPFCSTISSNFEGSVLEKFKEYDKPEQPFRFKLSLSSCSFPSYSFFNCASALGSYKNETRMAIYPSYAYYSNDIFDWLSNG